ncbi:MAG: Ig domain-containing protein [Lachnospiraceae bacterium]
MRKASTKSIIAFALAIMLALSSTMVIPVEAKAAPKAKKNVLNVTKKTMKVGQTTTLKVKKVSPSNASKSVKYSTSKKSVATVDSKGKIKAKAAGTATITVTSKSNSKVKATCKVTVKQPVKKIQISKNVLAVQKGKTVNIKATVKPKNASNKKLKYKTSNKKIATVNSKGKVKGIKNGTVTITVTAADGSKKKATCKVGVYTAKIKKATVSPSKKTLNVGQTVTLKTKIKSPSKGAVNLFTWTSSNKKVASVDANGKVKALKAGTATITGTAADGSKKKVTCKITVKQPVKKVTITPSSAQVTEGQKVTLKVNVSPANASNKKVTWKSNNTSIATVDGNGVVTGKKAGNATITATAADGSGKSASATVNVKAKPVDPKPENPVIRVSGITLDKSSVEVKANTPAFTLKATVTPANATNKTVTWKTSNASVADVHAGTVTVKTEGTATITATAGGKTASCLVKVIGKTVAFDTTQSTEYVSCLDKSAVSYQTEYQNKVRSITAKEVAEDIADIKDYWTLYSDTDKSLEEIFNSSKCNTAIEKMQELNLGRLIEEDCKITVTSPAHNKKIVSAVRTKGSKTVEAVITFETAQDGTGIVNIIQTGGNERKVTIKGIKRDYNAQTGMTELSGIVNSKYALKGSINAEVSQINVVREFANSQKVPFVTYAETANAYKLTINKAYYNEAVTELGISQQITDLNMWNIYTAK